MNAKTQNESFVKDVLKVDYGYKKCLVSALVTIIKKQTSQKGNEYQVLLIQDHTGVIKVLNVDLNSLQLEQNKIYNFLLDTKGHPYNPVAFVKQATELTADRSIFEPLEENSAESSREQISHLIKRELMLTLDRVQIGPLGVEVNVKKIVMKDERNNNYILRLWPNNQPYYDMGWLFQESGKEVFLEYVQMYKKENGNVTDLKVLSDITKINIV